MSNLSRLVLWLYIIVEHSPSSKSIKFDSPRFEVGHGGGESGETISSLLLPH